MWCIWYLDPIYHGGDTANTQVSTTARAQLYTMKVPICSLAQPSNKHSRSESLRQQETCSHWPGLQTAVLSGIFWLQDIHKFLGATDIEKPEAWTAWCSTVNGEAEKEGCSPACNPLQQTSVKPSFGVNHLRGGSSIVEVSEHQLGTPNTDLALVSGRTLLTSLQCHQLIHTHHTLYGARQHSLQTLSPSQDSLLLTGILYSSLFTRQTEQYTNLQHNKRYKKEKK